MSILRKWPHIMSQAFVFLKPKSLTIYQKPRRSFNACCCFEDLSRILKDSCNHLNIFRCIIERIFKLFPKLWLCFFKCIKMVARNDSCPYFTLKPSPSPLRLRQWDKNYHRPRSASPTPSVSSTRWGSACPPRTQTILGVYLCMFVLMTIYYCPKRSEKSTCVKLKWKKCAFTLTCVEKSRPSLQTWTCAAIFPMKVWFFFFTAQ